MDRYQGLNELMLQAKEVLGKILLEMGPETAYFHRVHAELEVAQNKRVKLNEENRLLENDTELKKQMAKKIIDTANEKAKEYITAAALNNAESIRRLDAVKEFVKEASLKTRMNELVKAAKE